nr:NAC domain-containing protein 82-like [Ipomoea batatas]
MNPSPLVVYYLRRKVRRKPFHVRKGTGRRVRRIKRLVEAELDKAGLLESSSNKCVSSDEASSLSTDVPVPSSGLLNFSLSAQPNLENHSHLPPPPKVVGAFDSSCLKKSVQCLQAISQVHE